MRERRRNVEINVGKACNSRCVFCLDGEPEAWERRWISLDDAGAELRRYRALGHGSVGFLGGEPTTWRHLPEAIALARAAGYTRIAIATNGMKLARRDYLERLIEAGLSRVTVSIHGHREALEDGLTGVPGAFRAKVAALRLLVAERERGRLRDNVSVNAVLNGRNYRHLPAMLRFFYGLGLDDVRVNFIRSEGRALGDLALTPRYSDVVPVLVKAVLLNELRHRRHFSFGGFPMCVLPAELLAGPLARRVVGELRDLETDCSIRSQAGRSRFNWRERKRSDLKRRLPACRGCRYDGPCEGVWRPYLDIHGDGEFSALP